MQGSPLFVQANHGAHCGQCHLQETFAQECSNRCWNWNRRIGVISVKLPGAASNLQG